MDRPQGIVYLASPYSHPDKEVMRQRFEAVCKASAVMMSLGYFVFSPIAHTHPIAMVGDLPTGWDYWEKYDRAMIAASCAVYVLKLNGWVQSVGVKAEIAIAKELGIPVTYVCQDNGDPIF